jgi:hypothetical protein
LMTLIERLGARAACEAQGAELAGRRPIRRHRRALEVMSGSIRRPFIGQLVDSRSYAAMISFRSARKIDGIPYQLRRVSHTNRNMIKKTRQQPAGYAPPKARSGT